MPNDDLKDEQRVSALSSACARCATAIAGASQPETGVLALARSFVNAANRATERVGCDSVADVARAVEFLACTSDEVPLDKAQAWFAARLDLLLELMQPSVRLSEEAGAFLAILERGLAAAGEGFRADAPRREAERAAAQAAREEVERAGLARLAQEQHRVVEEQRRSAPLIVKPIVAAVSEVPAHWVRSPDFDGEWQDRDLHAVVLEAKTHIRPGFPTFVVRRAGARLTFQCVLRWGGGPLAAKLMSGVEQSHGAAFEAVMKVFKVCHDAQLVPEKPWLWQLRDAFAVIDPRGPRATSVDMSNVVEVGPPRYVCKVTWIMAGNQVVHRSSTPRESPAAAYEEAFNRAREFSASATAAATAAVPAKRTIQEKLADAGLHKGAVEYLAASPGKHVCKLTWKGMDGATLKVQSDPMDRREEALDSALTKAVAREAERQIDWKAAIKTALTKLGIQAEFVAVKFCESKGTNGHKQYACSVTWGQAESFMHETGPYPSMREATLAAIKGVEETRDKVKSTRSLSELTFKAMKPGPSGVQAPQSQQQLRDIMRLIEGVQPRWLEERQRLLANSDRNVQESTRLRDISAYLAFLDPTRRGELEPALAERTFARMLTEATSAVTSDFGKINPQDDLIFLKTIAAGKVSKAGDPLALTPEFEQLCASKRRTPEAVLAHLVARSLVNRRGAEQLTLGDAGFRLLLKYIGPRGFSQSASISDAAAAKLAQVKAGVRLS